MIIAAEAVREGCIMECSITGRDRLKTMNAITQQRLISVNISLSRNQPIRFASAVLRNCRVEKGIFFNRFLNHKCMSIGRDIRTRPNRKKGARNVTTWYLFYGDMQAVRDHTVWS